MIRSYRNEVMGTAGLVGYWRLSDISGTTALATTGPNGTYANTPTLGGLGTISVEPNPAPAFDRVSLEHVSISTGIPAGTSRGTTLACLIRPDGAWEGNGDHSMFNWGHVNNPAIGFAWWEWWQGAGGTIIYWFADGTTRFAQPALSLTTGQTYHLVMSHDYVAKTFTTYVDGAFLAVIDLSAYGTPNVIAANAPSYIGSYNGTLYGWPGVIDEVAIFNRPLTGGEASYLARLARGY